MVYPKNLQYIYDKLEHIFRQSGVIAGKSGRHMKFPYTLTAKIVQFPYFYYMKNNNIWMYYPLGCLGGLYFFVKLHNIFNSEENVKSWAETQRRNAEKEHEH